MGKMSELAMVIEQAQKAGPVLCLYRVSLQTPSTNMVWWSPYLEEAQLLMAQNLEDATRMTKRGTSEWAEVLMETVVATGGDESKRNVCNILNGLGRSTETEALRIENGEVVSYVQNKRPDGNWPVQMEPSDWPTQEYREWYAWLVTEPSMYHICATARTSRRWLQALSLSQARVPKHVAVWLWRNVGGGKK